MIQDKEYKWIKIEFLKKSTSGITNLYSVKNKEFGSNLGIIKWNSGWRRYAFYPFQETWFEQDCLKDIADFLEILKEYRDLTKDKKKQGARA